MNNVSTQAAYPGALFQPDQAGHAPPSLRAGDMVVFDGFTLRVVSGGAMQLPTGLVEVAHVQRTEAGMGHDRPADVAALAPALGAPPRQTAASPQEEMGSEIGLSPALARKLTEYMGAVQGQIYQLGKVQVELIEGSRKALETFHEADRFMAKLRG